MLSGRVSCWSSIDQPEITLSKALECLGISVSLWLAVHCCSEIWPGEPLALYIAASTTWEGARLYFTPVACMALVSDGHSLGKYALVALVAVLTAGSVSAVMVAFEAADARDRMRILSAHPLYQNAELQLHAAKVQLKLAEDSALTFSASEQGTTPQGVQPDITALRDGLRVAATVMADARNGHLPTEVADAQPADAQPGSNASATVLHLVVAIALKLIAPAARLTRRMRFDGPGAPTPLAATPRAKLEVTTLQRAANDSAAAPSEYALVESAVAKDQLHPTTRAIQKFAGVGQEKARRIQAIMLGKGLIEKCGCTYIRAPKA